MGDAAIRLGIVGCGYAARELHAPRLAGHPDFDVDVVCDLNPPAAEALGRRLNARVVSRWQDIIEDPNLDAVVVLTPLHADIVRAALCAGRHVFVEKPLCEHPAKARELADLASATGLVLEVGTMRRYDPALQVARSRIAELGQVRWTLLRDAVSVSGIDPAARPELDLVLADAIPMDLTPADRKALQTALLQAVHDLSLLRSLFGDPLEVHHAERSADGWCLTGELRAGGVPCLYAIAEFALIHLPRADVALDIEITGETGAMALHFDDALWPGRPTEILLSGNRLEQAPADVHRLQWDAFASRIREGEVAPADALAAAEDVALLWRMAGVSPD